VGLQGGEALQVVDPNEAWVFHILADDTGTGAVWAAQKVPAGHIAAVANQFIIRTVLGVNHGPTLQGLILRARARMQASRL
jgi:dipeptidase